MLSLQMGTDKLNNVLYTGEQNAALVIPSIIQWPMVSHHYSLIPVFLCSTTGWFEKALSM